MQERRLDARLLLAENARVLVHGTQAEYDCILRDISAGGARLLVPAAPDIVEDLTLTYGADGATICCRVVWQRPGEMGVMFVS
ncbi:MAG: PilZ domain-containing protein [Methylobacterium sp.]|uniref:PilZ domain-containing protein n=1 Tax=Methylobacterium sp. TaxID=409 RepID=UPI00259109A8|nr:PilZ domain-containing protein [Methylobacterium sp.]MBY0295054.1 PilZ domain-containing protein [Methylobacterium sp.]